MFEISNQSDLDLGPLEDLMQEFMPFAQERHGFRRPPKLFLLGDEENAADPLGKTGGYNPDSMEVTIYVSGRHPKDILRSFSHELVHHNQNERGDLSDVLSTVLGYAQDDPHMRDMEREAYEQGNLCFRDWEDGRKKQLQESIYYETIIGGNDMSEKKPLKEWKDNEINTRLMEKFGLTKEGADSGEADSITIHDETTAEKRSGDEEPDEEEDEEESISGLGRNSTNETLSRLNEEVSHLLQEWDPGPLPSTDAYEKVGKGRGFLSHLWDVLPHSVKAYGDSWSPFGASSTAAGKTPGGELRISPEDRGKIYPSGPAGSMKVGPADKLSRMQDPGEYERGTDAAKEDALLAVVDALMMGGELSTMRHAAKLKAAAEGAAGAAPASGAADIRWLDPSDLQRIDQVPPIPGKRAPDLAGPLTDAEKARRLEMWRVKQAAEEAVGGGVRQTSKKGGGATKGFEDDWFNRPLTPDYPELAPQSGARWGYEPERGFYGFATDDLAKWEAKGFIKTKSGRSVNELAELAHSGNRQAILELDSLGGELYQTWKMNEKLPLANRLNPANWFGIGTTRGYVPGRGRLQLTPRIQNRKGLAALGVGAGAGYSWLNPEHIADLGSDDMVRPNPFPLGHGVGLPDPRSDLAAWTKPWYPIRPGYSRDPLDPNEQPKKYIVWNAKAGKIIAKRDVGKPPFKKERWDGWNKDPDIQIISNPATAAKKAGVTLTAPKKRDDLNERAPYIWEELNESLDLDENFYDTLFEGVEDMWAKETKE
jgi:hypothetical protein